MTSADGAEDDDNDSGDDVGDGIVTAIRAREETVPPGHALDDEK